MWSKIKVWKRLRAYCSHCCPNNHGVVSLQAMASCVSPIQAFKNLDGQNLIAWSSLSEALDLQCLIFKWGDMPLKKFVDLGHLDSHCHPVANACTTEMQVTSLVPRLSTPPCTTHHHAPHNTWTRCSVDGLRTRLSPLAHLNIVHSCMICNYKISHNHSSLPLLLTMMFLQLWLPTVQNIAVASRLWCVMTQTLQFSLITQSPFSTFDLWTAESTSLRTTFKLTSVHREERRTVDPTNTNTRSLLR